MRGGKDKNPPQRRLSPSTDQTRFHQVSLRHHLMSICSKVASTDEVMECKNMSHLILVYLFDQTIAYGV